MLKLDRYEYAIPNTKTESRKVPYPFQKDAMNCVSMFLISFLTKKQENITLPFRIKTESLSPQKTENGLKLTI